MPRGVELSLFKPPNEVNRHQTTQPGGEIIVGIRDLLVADFDADGLVDIIVSDVTTEWSVARWSFFRQAEGGAFDFLTWVVL